MELTHAFFIVSKNFQKISLSIILTLETKLANI